MSKRLRCKDKHPAMDALNQVFGLMSKLELDIHVGSGGRTVVTVQGTEYELFDVDDPHTLHMNEFPPLNDFKLVRYKED